ncbi:sulfatase-like hydrolase/transferase [Pelagicoccus sp. SDUM812005]|uniref:sulfatase family protein n=1 Tax=Pelagicoccus sp. SDUM812005 TaxID=3041257 RepID=UPI00280FBD2C|nr:sulfatase-like hydrolase/transferase [Pelagicoccus sp. SDUM812005]MDQ8180320.1 sulfatase-like hydrolase/transferase [Pelagicoccus sp. SDUM812005]
MNYRSKSLVTLFVLFGLTLARGTEGQPPNIIFFIADDMYKEMFNCLNEEVDQYLTPNIDRLAREGTVMVNQNVVSPVCTPSRYNCMAGQYASRAVNREFINRTATEGNQTVIQWNTFIVPGQKILPHYLKEAGYTTGMVGKNHVIEAKGLYQFEDYWADSRNPAIVEKVQENYRKTEDAIRNAGFDYAGSIYFDNPNFIGLGELAVQNMDWIAESGLEFIEQNAENPFFLYFATTLPHAPNQPERSWKADPLITANGYLESPPKGLPARETLPERVRKAGVKGRNAENVLWLDDALGALISKLEEKGVLDNTVIFFFNDHGQRAKGTLYRGGTETPVIVWKQGGFEVGNRSEAYVQNIDFAPTILDFAGASYKEQDFDGRSFKKVLQAETNQSRKSTYHELGYARAVVMDGFKYYAIRYPEYAENWSWEERGAALEAYNEGRRMRKMNVVNEDPAAPFSHFSNVPGGEAAEHESYGKLPFYFDRDQLYDLENDPGETKNLAEDPRFAKKLWRLKKELRRYINDLPGEFKL